MSMETIDLLKERFADAVEETHNFRSDHTARVKREAWLPVATFLRNEAGFDMWIDLTAADYQGREEGLPRFEVICHLRRMKDGARIRIKARLPESDPSIDTLKTLWKGADWMERECHEMYGIDFKGHGDQRPLLLYAEFVGFPLRKDYPIGRRQPRIPLLGSEERRFSRPEDETPHGHLPEDKNNG